ncbi:MAG: GGDEF domain-containing protein [Gammaproteobacteria bacterium]|nr:GGDEF domain-containing protein [Gammaproteobacteria bacterium]
MDTHPYPDDYSKASEYLRMALSLLSSHKIPPSPVNYQLGYECIAGRNEALKSNLEQLLEQPAPPNDEDLWNLYRRFCLQDEKALEVIRQELRNVILNIQGDFKKTGGELNRYSNTLNRFANILEQPLSEQAMSLEVQKVLEDTREVKQTHNNTEEQISSVLSEMESMRQELQEVKTESMTDGLTGISNRRALDTTLEKSILEAREQNHTFCMLLGDIDHFKHFNDSHGHLVGDKVLRFVASTLTKCTKGNDFVARFGGEEFAVILPKTDMNGARVVAEHIRKAISSGDLKDRRTGSSYGRITISIGVAQFSADDLPHTLLQRTDDALYRAKQRGRNRIERAA